MGKRTIEITAELIEEEEGGYTGYCPELDIYTQGEDVEDALANLKEAALLRIKETRLQNLKLKKRSAGHSLCRSTPKLPRITGDELVRALQKEGLEVARRRGSHVQVRKSTAEGTATFPVPVRKGRTLKPGTLRGRPGFASSGLQSFYKGIT